ncbi:unnamed protein product, partial [Aphanomyces euteiches]
AEDPMLIDARLNAKGKQQVSALRRPSTERIELAQVQALHQRVLEKKLHESIQVVITSPLTRAIETALGGFEGTGIPIQVNPLCREMLDASCDVGRQPAELAREFEARGVDMSKLSEYWWLNTPTDETKIIPHTPKELKALKETMNDMEARVRRFLAEIEALPESTLAVVCHGDFISWLTSTYPANCAIVKTTLRQLWAQRQ